MIIDTLTPRIERLDDRSDPRYGKFLAEPLERGYGTTLGSALRRVLLSFIPGTNWENFLGFIITMGIIMVIFYFALLVPRRHIEKVCNEGPLFRMIGTALGFLNTAIGMVLFAVVLNAYPIFDWLQRAVSGSAVISWLDSWLGFIQSWLPAAFG